MKIQFLRNHLLFKEGQIVGTFADGFCQVLIDRGIAKPVLDGVPNKMVETPKIGDGEIHTKPAKRVKHK